MKRRLVYLISLPVLLAALFSSVLVYVVVQRASVNKIEAEAFDEVNTTLTHLQNILNSQLTADNLEDARLSLSVTAMHYGMRTLLLSDDRDRILLSNRYIQEGGSALEIKGYQAEQALRVREAAAPKVEFSSGRDHLQGYYPVTLQIAEKGLGLRKLGVLYFDYDVTASLQRARREAALYSALFGGLLLLSAVSVSLLLRRLVSARIERLLDVTQRFAAGKSEARANLVGNDEIAYLGQAFDAMATQRETAEMALRKSEALLSSLIDNMPAMIFVKRASDLSFEKLNRAGENLLGLSEQELLGKSDFDFFPREQAEFFVANDRAVLASHRLVDITEEPIQTRTGETRYLHTLKIGIYDEAGLPTHLLGVSIDISEQKRIELALQHERDYATSLVNTVPMIVLQLDTDGRVEFVNPFFEQLTGYRLDEIRGRDWFATFLPARDLDRIRAVFTQSMATGQVRGNVNPIVTRAGVEVDIEWNAQTMLGAEGKPASVLAVGMDVTERKRAQLQLQHNRDLLDEAQRLGHLGSWELDLLSGELRWSDEIYRIFELDPAQFQPSYENFLNVIHPDDRDKVNQAYSRSLQDHQPYGVVHRLLMRDGRVKWVREQCSSDFDADGRPLRSVGAVQDITEQKLAEDRLRVAAVTFEMHEAIMITDAHARIVRVNQAFQDITGYTPEEVIGKNPRMLSSGRQDAGFYAAFWQSLLANGTWSGEIWDRRKNGQVYPKWLTVTAVKNNEGEVSEYVAIFSDITARKQAEEEIRNLAFYDALTRLPNRRLLLDRFRQALSTSARSNLYGAVMFLDLDRFKTLNDTQGHDFGDLLLMEVSGRIQSCVREADTVSRLGGDEFVILLEEVGEDAAEVSRKVAHIAEKIRTTLAEPYEIKGHECHSSPSIGVTLYRGNLESVDELLKHADMAMYQAKDAGRNAVRFFDPMMQQAVENRAALEADLRSAIPRQQLRLFYQIQVDSENRPLGAEALIRWQHPQRGMVSPGEFIPVAEESSLIIDIGDWVLETACRQLAEWQRDPRLQQLVIAVNVSAQQFMKLDFVERVSTALRLNQAEPSLLKLELTESMVLADINDVVKKMHALKALGVRLSMDDFGTGYSSLSYLKQLPLDQIKIDQSFVRDVINDPNDAVLVKTIIDMAQNFRLNVIAEGVETEAQLAFLKQHGCMAYQGYLFSKPVPIEQLQPMLLAKHA